MAADPRPPKSILKKESPAAAPRSRAAPDPKDVALEHARILQQRKEIEARILDDVVLLSEYPNHTSDPSRPDRRDAGDFRARVRLFQPSDYDDLVEERNVNGLCGYTLCPRPRRQKGPGGEWTLSSSGQIVRRRDFEKWCSQACARRALYVMVQLNETAAWERAGIPDIEIDLFDEGGSAEPESDVDRLARKMGQVQLENQRQAARDTAALAIERGEPSSAAAGGTRKTKVEVDLMEKDTEAPETTKSGQFDDIKGDSHLMVDGYKIDLSTRPKT